MASRAGGSQSSFTSATVRCTEGSQRGNGISEQVGGGRVRGRRRPAVDRRAAPGERSGAFDEGRAQVPRRGEARDERVAIDLLLGNDEIGVSFDDAAGNGFAR